MPFLVAGGDVPAGKSLDMLAQPVDILPSVAELAGADVAPVDAFQGQSFAAAVRDSRPHHRTLSVTGGFVNPGADGRCPAECVTPWVTDGRWGFAPVGASGDAELYDLHADPFAEVDVAGGHGDVLADLRGQLRDHLSGHAADAALVACWAGEHA